MNLEQLTNQLSQSKKIISELEIMNECSRMYVLSEIQRRWPNMPDGNIVKVKTKEEIEYFMTSHPQS